MSVNQFITIIKYPKHLFLTVLMFIFFSLVWCLNILIFSFDLFQFFSLFVNIPLLGSGVSNRVFLGGSFYYYSFWFFKTITWLL